MWKTVLSFIFPKYCVNCKQIGNYICDTCFSYIQFSTTAICPECNKKTITGATHPACDTSYSLNGLVSAVDYTRVIKRLIYQYKYSPYVSDLTEAIGSLCVESYNHNEIFQHIQNKEVLYVPVPLSCQKYKKRGYNHASLLSSYVAQYYDKKYSDKIILRIVDTKPQYMLSKVQRSTNVKNAFKINDTNKEMIKGKVVVVVDDVATTCSTLREISKVLKRNGAKEVWGVVFAHENKPVFRK